MLGGRTSKEPTVLDPSREEGVKVNGWVGAELEVVDGGVMARDWWWASPRIRWMLKWLWAKNRWLLLVPALVSFVDDNVEPSP
jgi:hypothetical protein